MIFSRLRKILVIGALLFVNLAVGQTNIGQSIQFDGASYVNLGNYDLSGGQLTVECLFKSTGNNTSVTSCVAEATPTQINFDLQMGRFKIGPALTSGAPIQIGDGFFHHIAGVYDGQTITHYIDGCFHGSVPYNQPVSASNVALTFGIYFQSQDHMNGILDEIRIWRTARTVKELTDNFYNLPNPGSQPGLAAYFKFENNLQSEINGLSGSMVGNELYNNSGIILIDGDQNPSVSDVSCVNTNDGKISILPGNGTSLTSLNGSAFAYKYSYSNLLPGSYTFSILTLAGCTFDHLVTVKDVPNSGLNATANPNPVCNGQSLQLGSTINGDTNLVSFSWTGPANFSSNKRVPAAIPSTTSNNIGNYIVTATYGNCVVKDTVIVTGGNNPPTPDAGPDFAVCERDDIQLQATSPTAVASWIWTGPDTFSNLSQNPLIRPAMLQNEGMYYVMSSNGGCLSNPDSVFVAVNEIPKPNLGQDTILCPGEPFPLTPGSFTSYSWQDGSISPLYSVNRAGVFYVDVTDEIGCIGTDTLNVGLFCPTELYYPNTFTPDGDGYNDRFFLYSNNVLSFSMGIFNRWGEEFFSTKDIYEGWDGTYNGKPVPLGIYVVKASFVLVDQYGNQSKKDVTGKITLIR